MGEYGPSMTEERARLDTAGDEDGEHAAPSLPLDRWLQELRPALAAFLRRKLRDPADVDDALQETSLRVWRYAAGEEVRTPVSLCFRVAENVAVDFARAQDRLPPAGDGEKAATHAIEDIGPDRRAAGMQELELVRRVIGGLPPGCLRAAVMFSCSAAVTG